MTPKPGGISIAMSTETLRLRRVLGYARHFLRACDELGLQPVWNHRRCALRAGLIGIDGWVTLSFERSTSLS